MGVPITFLAKYNPDQFEILGMTKTPICYDNQEEALRKKQYQGVIQFSKNGEKSAGNKVNDGSAILVKDKPSSSVYYVSEKMDGYLLAQFPRILIKHRR